MRAVIYLRISQDRAGEERGVTRQREDCEQLVARRGWALHHVYIDNDISATSGKRRPEWEAMMAEVEAGTVQVVVGWTIDRTLRTGRDRLRLLEIGKANAITISIVRGSDMDLSTPSGRLAADILGAVAQNEIEVKSDRQRRAVEQAADEGRWVGGRKPFGYEADGVTILEAEAQAIREGYEALLGGVSLRAIASVWNADGFTTGQAPWRHTEKGERSPWRADSVRRVLINCRYAGLRPFRRDETAVRACWPPVVEEDTYRAAVRMLKDPGRHSGGTAGSGRQLLTGLALCGVPGCDHTVHGGGAKHGKPIYRCSSEHMLSAEKAHRAPGTHVNRLAAPVDEYIGRLVIEWARRPNTRPLLRGEDEGTDVEWLRKRARSLRLRLESIAAEFGAELPPNEFRAMRAPVARDLLEVEGRLADAGRTSALTALLSADDPEVAWDELGRDVGQRRVVIDALMVVRLHSIGRGVRTFRPETIEITWH